jgi:hypothetical protein
VYNVYDCSILVYVRLILCTITSVSEKSAASAFRVYDGDSGFSWNISKFPTDYLKSHTVICRGKQPSSNDRKNRWITRRNWSGLLFCQISCGDRLLGPQRVTCQSVSPLSPGPSRRPLSGWPRHGSSRALARNSVGISSRSSVIAPTFCVPLWDMLAKATCRSIPNSSLMG